MVILNALFAWLTEAGYLAGNPLALVRRRRAPTQARITRYLSHDLWETAPRMSSRRCRPRRGGTGCTRRAAAGY